MEQLRWKTPNKTQRYDNTVTNSPRLHITPIKQNEMRSKHTTYQNNAGCFTVLPSHITPPSGLTKIGRNPFEADVTSRLHQSMISPTIFTKVPSSLQESPEFKWTIDELAHIQPAKIEESLMQQVYSPDPEVESKAQEAIDRFFKENQIIPSPWDIKEKGNVPNINMNTPPSRPLEDLNSTKEFLKLKKDAWSQTVLSLPMNLPPSVEEVLKSYFTFTQKMEFLEKCVLQGINCEQHLKEQSPDNEDINLSNSSLRRKLFFNHEYIDNDNESFVSSSSIEMNKSVISSSPPQSGMLAYCTPLKKSLQIRRQSSGSRSLSPPNMSPIHNNEDNMHKRAMHFSSATRIDFATNMSIDDIDAERNQKSNDNNVLDTTYDTNDMKFIRDNRKLKIDNCKLINNDKTNLYDSTSMVMSLRCTNPINDIHSDSVIFDNKSHDAINLVAIEKEKSFARENYKQNNIIFGTFNPQSISSSVQDTGYQTYSMNSTMHTIDSYNNISINHNIYSSEQIACKDDTQLSWKENMRNVFSSTPAKCTEEEKNYICKYSKSQK